MSFIQETRQIEQESLASKSRFLGKGILWLNLCQVHTLDHIDCGGLGAGSSYEITVARGFLDNPIDYEGRSSLQRKAEIDWIVNLIPIWFTELCIKSFSYQLTGFIQELIFLFSSPNSS